MSLGISFGSINTGLPKDIVKQIIAAEKIPLQKMESRKEDINAKKQLVDELGKLLEEMRQWLRVNNTAKGLREFAVNADEEAVAVSVDKNGALPGNHQFEVVQLARKSSAMTSGFEDPNESYVGVGYIQYDLPNGETKDVYIDSNNATLNGVRDLINKDESNGMTASVINDGSDSDTPWRLVISLTDTGDGAKAEFPYFYFVDGEEDFFVEMERPAQDAIVKLDGFEIELPGNKTSDLIPGLTIDLLKAKPGEEFTLGVKEDSEAVTEKVNAFIDMVNKVLKFINEQNQMDENTNTKRTLGGDITLQTLESRLRSVVFETVMTASGPSRLGKIGIQFNRSGFLVFDEKVFQNQVKKDWQKTAQVLTGFVGEDGKVDGVVDKLQKLVENVMRYPSGLIPNRKKGLESKIAQIDRRIEDRQRIIDKKEKMLKDKFSRLEGTINRIKSQGAGLAALGGGQPAQVPQLG